MQLGKSGYPCSHGKLPQLSAVYETSVIPVPTTICCLPGANDICGEIFSYLPNDAYHILSQVCKCFKYNAFWCANKLNPGCPIPAEKLHLVARRITEVVVDNNVKEILKTANVVLFNVICLRASDEQCDILDDALLSLFPNVERLGIGFAKNITGGGLRSLSRVREISLHAISFIKAGDLHHMSELKTVIIRVDGFHMRSRIYEFWGLRNRFSEITVCVAV